MVSPVRRRRKTEEEVSREFRERRPLEWSFGGRLAFYKMSTSFYVGIERIEY